METTRAPVNLFPTHHAERGGNVCRRNGLVSFAVVGDCPADRHCQPGNVMLALATHPAAKSNCRACFHSAFANFCRCRHNHQRMFYPAKLGQNRESQLWFKQESKTLSIRVQKRHCTGKTNVVLPPALCFGGGGCQRQIINFRVFRMPAALALGNFGKHFRNWRRLPRQGLWL